MAKVLVTVHLGRHFRIFGQSDYKVLLDMGHEVHIAANFKSDIDKFENPNVIQHQIDFDRNPFSIQNLRALKQLQGLLKKEEFQLIHCHSPAGGAITRLASKKTRKKGTNLLYTAHGFHFYKGSPIKNWIMYYNFEKVLAKYTDCIITINEEDYEAAKNKLRVKNTKYIHGVGINLNKFKPQTSDNKFLLRQNYGFNKNDFILICVGELNSVKNQMKSIKAVESLKNIIPNVKLLLVGTGELEDEYKRYIDKKNLNEFVKLLGYRSDVPDLMKLSDILVSTSIREGLPVNVMEGMATGLPLIVSNCRGNRDLIKNGENGYVVDINNESEYSNSIEKLYCDKALYKKFKESNLKKIKKYSIENVKSEMKNIYHIYD